MLKNGPLQTTNYFRYHLLKKKSSRHYFSTTLPLLWDSLQLFACFIAHREPLINLHKLLHSPSNPKSYSHGEAIPDICHLHHLYEGGEKICHVENFQNSIKKAQKCVCGEKMTNMRYRSLGALRAPTSSQWPFGPA